MKEIAFEWLFSDVTPETIPHVVILPFENPDLFSHQAYHELLTDIQRFRCLTAGRDANGRHVGVMSSKLGAPAVALAVEALHRLGVKVIIGVGYCGSLSPAINCGDLVLPYASVRDDGTSERYVPAIYPAVADVQRFGSLLKLARQSGAVIHDGIVWSTDAVMLETDEKIEKWRSVGVNAVDMEVGAFYVVSRICGLSSVAILVASDSPVLKRRTDVTALSSGTRCAAKLAVEFASEVSSELERL